MSRFIDLPFRIKAGQSVHAVNGVGGIFQVAHLRGALLLSRPAIWLASVLYLVAFAGQH